MPRYKNLHGWVIIYNQYTDTFYAAKRENYASLTNGGPGVLKSKEINTLFELIDRTDGDEKKINKLLKAK